MDVSLNGFDMMFQKRGPKHKGNKARKKKKVKSQMLKEVNEDTLMMR